MFKATVKDARLWKSLLEAIAALTEEADFNITLDGMKLRSMDPSHVAMVDFEWPKTAFEEYDCSQPAKIKINLANMLKLLKRVKSEDSLEVTYDENTRKLKISVKGKIRKDFAVSTLEPSEEAPPTPKHAFNSKLKVVSSSLKEIIEDTQAVSDSMTLETTPEKAVAKAAAELGSATIELDKGSEALLDLQVNEPSRATYSLDFLAKIVRAGAAASEVATAEFSTNKPIKLEFEIPAEGRLAYYLAPRIEAEE